MENINLSQNHVYSTVYPEQFPAFCHWFQATVEPISACFHSFAAVDEHISAFYQTCSSCVQSVALCFALTFISFWLISLFYHRSHPPEPQIMQKHSASRLSYLFAHLHHLHLLVLSLLWSCLFCSSLLWLLPPLLFFHLSILSEVWLLNFLRLFCDHWMGPRVWHTIIRNGSSVTLGSERPCRQEWSSSGDILFKVVFDTTSFLGGHRGGETSLDVLKCCSM